MKKSFRDILEMRDYSMINLTMISLCIIVFSLFVIFYINSADLFTLNQDLNKKLELNAESIMIESKLIPVVAKAEAVKKQQDLSLDAKEDKLNSLFSPVINSIRNSKQEIYVKYLDFDLNKSFPDSIAPSNAFTKWLQSSDLSHLSEPVFASGKQSLNNTVAFAVPMVYHDKTVGLLWTEYTGDYLSFSSYVIFSKFLIFSILIWILAIVVLNYCFRKITKALETFSTMIIEDDPDISTMYRKLPELEPVLNKLKTYTVELKNVNSELSETTNKLTAIIEGITDGLFVLDREWKIKFANNETLNATKQQELIDKRLWDILPMNLDPLDYEKFNNSMHSDHAEHWESINLFSANHSYLVHTYPFENGLIIFFRDITDIKEQQQEYSRLERLNIIGQMAAGISHEVRNPLTTVRGFLQLFSSKTSIDKDKEYMDLMISEIDRANSIISDFLSLTKKNSDEMRLNNVNLIIQRIFPLIEADAFSNNKNIVMNLNSVPNTLLNESEIRQLILNLVRNGLEVTPENGKVTISTEAKEGRILLEIHDEGPGIPEELREKIGTPFFTTKGNGTGLGLATSISIARRHCGEIYFTSDSSGTTFQVFLAIS